MSACLVLRNLSVHTVQLVQIEWFEHEPPVTNGASGLLQNLLSFARCIHVAHPSDPGLATNAIKPECQDLQLHIPPFGIRKTSLEFCSLGRLENRLGDHRGLENARLTFAVGGQKYRLHIPGPKFESQDLQCLSHDPKFHFTGFSVRKGDCSHVAVCDGAKLHCWMKKLTGETPLNALSIPGTHNSPTCYKALPSVRCQLVNVREQLDNGIRFLDVRVQPVSVSSNRLILVHSLFPISFTGTKYLDDFLKLVYDFLEKNPSEAIIMSIKREGTGNSTDEQLARIIRESYTTKITSSKYWYTAPEIPKLDAARGKIVLFRRFRAEADIANECGINAETWTDNTPHDLSQFVCVQDFYKVLETVNIETKITYATDQLRRAASCEAHIPGTKSIGKGRMQPQPLHLNFLSGSNLWRLGCWPENIANKLNSAILQYLVASHAVEEDDHDWEGKERNEMTNGHGDGSTGIVVCDWVGGAGDWDLMRCIVAMNCKLSIREMEID